MAKAEEAHLRAYKSYSKRMSDHVAIALVVYTLALIFLVTPKSIVGYIHFPLFHIGGAGWSSHSSVQEFGTTLAGTGCKCLSR